MTIYPIRDYIIVSKNDAPQTTASGLFVAHAEEKNATGRVLAVGSGRVTMNGAVIPLDVSVGDTIVFNKNVAIEVKENGLSFFVIKEDQVICILK